MNAMIRRSTGTTGSSNSTRTIRAIVGPLLAPGLPGVPSSIGQNYPNPFNPATTIPFTVGSAESGSRVTMVFYDVSGRTIARHDLGHRSAGDHTFVWNPALSSGRSIPSGVYYCRLQIGKEVSHPQDDPAQVISARRRRGELELNGSRHRKIIRDMIVPQTRVCHALTRVVLYSGSSMARYADS